MPVIDSSSPLEDGLSRGARGEAPTKQPAEGGAQAQSQGQDGNPADMLSHDNLLMLAKEADRVSVSFAQRSYLGNWDKNYKAFRGEHFSGSKYLSTEYSNRSRLFRPKTRSAVEKDLAAAAGALFATVNAVTVSGGDDSDPMQRANASVMQELLNYRLDRSSGRNSIHWFLTAMGAREDADITGICCSKQYWDYKAKTIAVPAQTDADTGEEIAPASTKKKVTLDKPCCDLLPPENVGLHPAAHWMDPVNDGVFFTAWFPMTVGAIRERSKDERFPWQEITDEQFSKARVKQIEASQVRRAREGGQDRQEDNRSAVTEFDVCWVAERFMRIEGEDYCYWTLADHAMLCDPELTEDVYPAFGGERPYILGYGKLESHRIVPQSMVEVAMPMQMEINDLVNLRLDNVKESLKPLTLVRRGAQIDVDRLKRRGQNTVMLMGDVEKDIKFDRPTDVSASSYNEMERLNVDYDNIAGVFDSGSVQSNRQLNDTVGGMKILTNAANSVTEFNLRVWAETYIERVLSQLAKLEAYYESDDKVLTIAKKRAKAFKKFGFDEITDEMLSQEVFVRVSAGIGSADPMQKMQKLGAAIDQFGKVATASQEFKSGAIKPKVEEFADEIFGQAGFRDGFDRFFERGEPMPQPGEAPSGPSPEELAAQSADKREDRASKEKIAKLNAKTKLVDTLLHRKADRHGQKKEHQQEGRHRLIDLIEEMILGEMEAKRMAEQPQPADGGMGGDMGAPQPAMPQGGGMPGAEELGF